MFWRRLRELTRTLSFRVSLWHASVFLVSAGLVFSLIYFLLGAAIDRKDRDVIENRLREYSAVYNQGGIDALRDWTGRINKARAQRMFFVRVTKPDGNIEPVALPEDWSEHDLALLSRESPARGQTWLRVSRDPETDLTLASSYLSDGTLFQVGRSSDSRAKLLGKFRRIFGIVILPVIVLGFIGGTVVTNRMTRPLRGIVTAASSIIDTGRMNVRVPTRSADDELQDLVVLFNRLLDCNEELVRTLRESLDNVAHDLRTPLARLRVTLENALREKGNLHAQHDSIGEALEETEHVQTIIKTLMEVAQAESGLMTLQHETMDVGSLIDDVIALYEHVAEEKNVNITKKIRESYLANVDRARMRQVFANLLDNAIKYTPSGGSIAFSACRRDGEIEISVSDTGSGIGEEDLPRIWERLYRGDKSRGEHGLGLGLSLVKAVVEAHHGRVTVTSALHKGSEFKVHVLGD